MDERLPLLPKPPTPLPVAQLVTVCLVRLADPISFCQIFPYINQFIAHLHITDDPSQIGFYSGLVESSFAIAQLLSIYTCSRLSDTIGRRPVIMLGTLGVGLATVSFGLSTSLPALLLSRVLAGLFAGTAAVNHAILGEITDSTNRASAFPIYGLVWPLGGIIGPLIGGAFSEPARKYPLFQNTIFDTHPYFLPCLIAGCVSLLGLLLAYICLQETLPSKSKSSPTSPTPSLLTLLSTPIIRSLCFAGYALESNTIAFNVIFVLFCFTPHPGGLGLPSSTIGLFLASSGIISTFIQIFLLPALLKRISPERIYDTSMKLWVPAFAGLGLLGVLNSFQVLPLPALWIGIWIVLAVASRITDSQHSSTVLVFCTAPILYRTHLATRSLPFPRNTLGFDLPTPAKNVY